MVIRQSRDGVWITHTSDQRASASITAMVIILISLSLPVFRAAKDLLHNQLVRRRR